MSLRRRLQRIAEQVAAPDVEIVLRIYPPGCTPPPPDDGPKRRYYPGMCTVTVIPPPPAAVTEAQNARIN